MAKAAVKAAVKVKVERAGAARGRRYAALSGAPLSSGSWNKSAARRKHEKVVPGRAIAVLWVWPHGRDATLSGAPLSSGSWNKSRPPS